MSRQTDRQKKLAVFEATTCQTHTCVRIAKQAFLSYIKIIDYSLLLGCDESHKELVVRWPGVCTH